jgi:hypothetical protein
MSSDWVRRVPGVQWPDVWAWAASIREEFGYWADIHLAPPLPNSPRRGRWGTLAIDLTMYLKGDEMGRIHVWTYLVEPGKATAEEQALQLLVSLHQQLDSAAWEAERAARPTADE